MAVTQLQNSLDIHQRLGWNGLATHLPKVETAPLPTQHVLHPTPRIEPDPLLPLDPVEERIKREKLRQAELITFRLEREDQDARGHYMKTRDARAEMSRMAGNLVTLFEGALADFSAAVAGQFHVPNRDVLHLLRQEFFKIRERSAQNFGESADVELEHVEDEDELIVP